MVVKRVVISIITAIIQFAKPNVQRSFSFANLCGFTKTITGNTKQLDDSEVSISRCKKNRCRLRKKSVVEIELKFTPDHNVKKLTTSVSAIILGVPLPFIGVDGTSACDNLYLDNGETKTNCPLKAGQNYLYKNSFEVLQIYPTIASLDVHWALKEGNNNDLVCFEVPAKITN